MRKQKIEFEALDGQSRSFTRVVHLSITHPDPVLLVHGAGVRSNIFSPPQLTGFFIKQLWAMYGFGGRRG